MLFLKEFSFYLLHLSLWSNLFNFCSAWDLSQGSFFSIFYLLWESNYSSPLLKDSLPLHCLGHFARCQLSIIRVGLFLDFLFALLTYMFTSLPPSHRLDWRHYIVLILGRMIPLTFSFLNIVLVILFPMPFHKNFGIRFSICASILLGWEFC